MREIFTKPLQPPIFRWFVVATGARLVICDHYTLQEQKVIEVSVLNFKLSIFEWITSKSGFLGSTDRVSADRIRTSFFVSRMG